MNIWELKTMWWILLVVFGSISADHLFILFHPRGHISIPAGMLMIFSILIAALSAGVLFG